MEFGGLKSDQVKQLKDLELENSRLRKAVSDLTLDKLSSTVRSSIRCVKPRSSSRAWQRHYNAVRAHASLGYKPPAPEVFVRVLSAWPGAPPRQGA